MKLLTISICAALALAGTAAAAKPKPKPKATAAPVCAKLLPTATLNSLTGASLVDAKLQGPPIAASACAWDDPADTEPANPYAGDVMLHFTVGAAEVAKDWNTYAHPKLVRDAITPVSGIGDKAVEVNTYIAVVKGQTFFQLWAGNNGQHLTYPQLETVAKYLVSKIK